MVGYEDHARLLRTWRERVAHLTQEQVAALMPTTKSMISMWENARRGMTFAQLQSLDRCYGAGGALADLANSVGTSTGLRPRQQWTCVLSAETDGPCWAWLRPRAGSGRIRATVAWGPFLFGCSQAVSDRGLLVQFRGSSRIMSIRAVHNTPGWVDLGRGIVPGELEIPTYDFLTSAQLLPDHCLTGRLVSPIVASRFHNDPEYAERAVRFFGHRPDLVRAIFESRRRPSWQHLPSSIVDESTAPFKGDDYQRLRSARRLSLAGAAGLATSLAPGDPVTAAQVRSLESGGRPRVTFLRSRLDLVYRGNGYTTSERVYVTKTRSNFSVSFPPFWVGPVWFAFLSDSDLPGQVELQCGGADLRVPIRPGTVLTCQHYGFTDTPYSFRCPARYEVHAGMGVRADALVLDMDDFSIKTKRAMRAVGLHEVIPQVFGRDPQQLTSLLE